MPLIPQPDVVDRWPPDSQAEREIAYENAMQARDWDGCEELGRGMTGVVSPADWRDAGLRRATELRAALERVSTAVGGDLFPGNGDEDDPAYRAWGAAMAAVADAWQPLDELETVLYLMVPEEGGGGDGSDE